MPGSPDEPRRDAATGSLAPTEVLPGPPGTRFFEIRWFAVLDSTNRYLVDQARSGSPEGLVVVADHQTAGRGRLGRRWEAPPGANLLVSVLLRPTLAAEDAHLAAVAGALALADACRAVAEVELWVKWPNDLLDRDGRKVAGVLAEGDLPPGSTAPAVVVGAGLNVAWPGSDDPVDHFAVPAVALDTLAGRKVDRTEVLLRFLVELERRVAGLGSPAGREELRDELVGRCLTLGAAVRVDLGGETVTGRAVALSPEGHLVVDTGSGRRTVAAGDVVHLR